MTGRMISDLREAQDEGAAGERERIAREIDPVAFLDVQSRASGRNGHVDNAASAAMHKALGRTLDSLGYTFQISRADPGARP